MVRAVNNAASLGQPFGNNNPVVLRYPQTGKLFLKAFGVSLYFTDDRRLLFYEDIAQGKFVTYYKSPDTLVIGRRNGSEQVEEIERVKSLNGSGIKIGNRRCSSDYVHLAHVSENFGRFEDKGHYYVNVSRASFGFLKFHFDLSLEGSTLIQETARKHRLLMSGGPCSETIEFWDIEEENLLCEIPVKNGRIVDKSGRRVSLLHAGRVNLLDFVGFEPDVKYKKSKEITFLRDILCFDMVRCSFESDARLKAAIVQNKAKLVIFGDHLQLDIGNGESYSVQLDQQSFVLGSDGERFVARKSGKEVQIANRGQMQFFSFFEVACKMDKGIINAGQRTGFRELCDKLLAKELDENAVLIAEVFGKEKLILKKEEVPLFEAAPHYANGYYMVLKKQYGRVLVSLHDKVSREHIKTFEYFPRFNRFGFYNYSDEAGLSLNYVDRVGTGHSLNRYKENCYLTSQMDVGTVILVRFDKDQLLEVRGVKSKWVKRHELADLKGNKYYVFGEDLSGAVLKKVGGWITDVPLYQDNRGDFVFRCDQDIIVPRRAQARYDLKVGEKISIYFEFGHVIYLMIRSDRYRLKTLRDIDLKVFASAAGRLRAKLLPKGVSLLENFRINCQSSVACIVQDNLALRLFPLGKNGEQFKNAQFNGSPVSAAVMPNGQVIYWAEKEEFDESDLAIIKAIRLRIEDPGVFRSQFLAGAINSRVRELWQGIVYVLGGLTDGASLERLGEIEKLILAALDAHPFQADLIDKLFEIRTMIKLKQARQMISA